ncbi:DUF1972 domain-containing protein [Rhodoferax sp.]|uniref:DUF1972 domain-containing protein n=1 Tax=Rhodoferax sp. TaxID=50421 RepID=UPI00262DDCB3|nr:DUF1972 domain-containing protein [Rhodoferax sp.]MDD2808398.1 DUF1972 domain-containing protein [Rhodoferax sp.]
MTIKPKTLRILGTRGVPAAHGGFETFAEYLSLYLVANGWRVVVYCQDEGTGSLFEDIWQGVERVRIPVSETGTKGSIIFDWKSIQHACQHNDLCLTLGYNTAIFSARLRLNGVPNLFNMDGIEWHRGKWGPLTKFWFWLNDWAGCFIGNHLVADHPRIKEHLRTRVSDKKITMIAYGADLVTDASLKPLKNFDLVPGKYLTVIARAEPENSILEIVKGFSVKPRGLKLLVIGNYESNNVYHQRVKSVASDEVQFAGAIYDKHVLHSLRFHSLAYIHGHQVGGTNPSLVEALGAGNAVIAHDNQFNRWVAGQGAKYFSDAQGFAGCIDRLEENPALLEALRGHARERFKEAFYWSDILGQYQKLLESFQPKLSGQT